ncbi:MAG: PKD domain-containing protein [Bacteroidia bacterium]|nr:PKD domain-containing protein [Bacteroidia bacterium]
MKKIIYLSLFLAIALLSCNKIPEARFSIFPQEPAVGQDILFNNDSKNAKSYEWNFGDGYKSNEVNPVHSYDVTGTFDVKLTAYSKSDLSDEATMSLEILPPTLLDILVLEYYQEYSVPNARVRLYPDSTSWDLQENMVIEGYTDDDGIVVFANLDPQIYYVDVLEAHHDNYLLRDEDTDFIMTGIFVPHQINWFIAWVDYYDTKGAGRDDNSYLLKKPERKVTDKSRIPISPLKEDWQTLYKRSIKVK